MSSPAAVRLERLGYGPEFRYKPGKLDWFAHGLPMEGTRTQVPQAKDAVQHDIPTCRPDERLGQVHAPARATNWNACIVTDEAGVMLGRLRRDAWTAPPETPVEPVMENRPTIFRPGTPLEPLVQRLADPRVGGVLVTDSDGVLIGVLYRKDAEEKPRAAEAAAPES